MVEGVERSLKINRDNRAAKLCSKNDRSSSKSKLIDKKIHVVKDTVQSFQLSIEHISTDSNIADTFTKGLPPKVFHEHVAHMGIVRLEGI